MAGDAPPAPHFDTKADLYGWLLQQVTALIDTPSCRLTPQATLVLDLGNVAALCFYELNRFSNPGAALEDLCVNWFGFYLFQGPGLLALGPFQGRPACTEIRTGRGVVGTAADAGHTLVVADVHEFPGHIACDSASASEIVVPILLANGSVVGVIDVDSTALGHFDEEDKKGLEAIAEVLVKHMEFPMARALAVNPGLAFQGFAGLGEAHPPPAIETKVTSGGLPFMTIEAPRPDKTEKSVGGWLFTTERLDRIMAEPEQEELCKRCAISALPEIPFHHNTLRVAREAHQDRPLFFIQLEAVMQNAAAYYKSDEFQHTVGPQMVIPVSEAWATTGYDKFDPNVDWAWRNNFYGLASDEGLRLVPRPADAPGINWELLKDRTLPIVLFDAFDLFEDDLHDHGQAQFSIKLRVMNTAFFILQRHFVRVDGYASWFREVRIFHEFDVKSASGAPHIVIVEELKRLSLEDAESSELKDLSADALSQRANTVSSAEYILEVTI